jgi:hypothetical protein
LSNFPFGFLHVFKFKNKKKKKKKKSNAHGPRSGIDGMFHSNTPEHSISRHMALVCDTPTTCSCHDMHAQQTLPPPRSRAAALQGGARAPAGSTGAAATCGWMRLSSFENDSMMDLESWIPDCQSWQAAGGRWANATRASR